MDSILKTYRHNTEEWIEDDWYEGNDGEGLQLEGPEQAHHQQHPRSSRFFSICQQESYV